MAVSNSTGEDTGYRVASSGSYPRPNAAAEATEVKRLNVNLPAPAFEELQRMASSSGRTMTEVVRLALGLAKIALEEERKDNKLVIAKADGQILKEIVLPK